MEFTTLQKALWQFPVALLFVLIVFYFAKRAGYFRLSPPNKPPLRLMQPIGAFLIYFLATIVIAGLLRLVFLPLFSLGLQDLTPFELGWIQVGSIGGITLVLIGYCFLIKKEARAWIFWGDQPASCRRFFKSYGMGCLSWLIGYPFVILVSILMSLLSWYLWGEGELKQTAVEQVKRVAEYPVLFGCMIAAVVVVVPFVEELLFRGFLQSYLKRFMGRAWAIVIASLIFALMHFSMGQGVGNLLLITSLFVFSLFLGFIYERQKTLWAPVALHTVFNGVSILLIVLTKS